MASGIFTTKTTLKALLIYAYGRIAALGLDAYEYVQLRLSKQDCPSLVFAASIKADRRGEKKTGDPTGCASPE